MMYSSRKQVQLERDCRERPLLTTSGELSSKLLSKGDEPVLRGSGTRVDSVKVLVIDINTIEL
jgi:hypothetical protein